MKILNFIRNTYLVPSILILSMFLGEYIGEFKECLLY